IRLAGVSVTWWYAVALAPGVAVLVRLIVGTPAPVRALASWVAPALFVSVAMQIFVAAPAAPLVALAAILAPMMAGCVRALASRPVVAFDESSVWVTQGRTLSTPTSVTLTEAQRMTATSIAMWRVVPGDEGDRSALEWRLVPGDSLALRSGDQVLLPAGAGVRFESGRRVPGAPISGVAWADATASSALDGLLAAAGAVVTLVGGGL